MKKLVVMLTLGFFTLTSFKAPNEQMPFKLGENVSTISVKVKEKAEAYTALHINDADVKTKLKEIAASGKTKSGLCIYVYQDLEGWCVNPLNKSRGSLCSFNEPKINKIFFERKYIIMYDCTSGVILFVQEI